MVVKENIIEDLDKYYVLYKYDIKGIFKSLHNYPNVLEKINHYDKEEIKNLIKFFDSLIFIIDYNFFGRKGLLFAFENYDYYATPLFQRIQTVIMLLENEIIDIDEVIKNKALTEKEMIYEKDLPLIHNINDSEAISKRIPAIPELYECCEKALSEVCYRNLQKLVNKHLFDFKKDCYKIMKAIYKMDNDTQKKELLYILVNSPLNHKDLLLSDPFLQSYSFEDIRYGEDWKNIYDILKETVL